MAVFAAALVFGGSAYSGDLGRADIGNRNDLPLLLEFRAQCVGPMDRWEGAECIVKFDGDNMSVDGSAGIKKNQIISFSSHWGSDVRKYVDVLYRTSDGGVSVAQFGFRYGNRAKQFLNALVLFMAKKE